ncbi:EG95 [Echinococcus multilocularis]|uniref:EG95 n=1 Tax=Echinococcus multilocularis TaxID=6211 RepID=A0A068Y0I3_ECHMU|nr:EG95 [Echinococcus multilocularis]
MASQFCLVVCAACILATGSGGEREETTIRTESPHLVYPFALGHLGSRSLQIIWDTKAFRGSHADEVVLSAMAANSSNGEIRKAANFSQGEITLRELQPNQFYSVKADIRMRHESLWKDTCKIRTLPAEEEGSTVLIDASGSTSVAFAGIFLCLTVFLVSALA